METIDTHLFGWNNRPLSTYLDPGCPVFRFRRLERKFLLEACPNTLLLAERIGMMPWRKDVWGMEGDDGRFFTISTGSGKRGARPFSGREILRTFVGKQGAVTTSDAPYFKQWNRSSVPKHVSVLRIDVDDDRSWKNEDEEAILIELRREKELCAQLGLPFHAFKTGRRGHQGVIPLPVSMPFSLATLFMEMYLHLHERSEVEAPMVDKTNLTGQMRMPGGNHRTTRDLGLFIDIDKGNLFDIEMQASLMVDAFRYSTARRPGDWEPGDFKAAAQEILDWTTSEGIERNRRVEPVEMRRAVAELGGNPIVQRFKRACNHFGVELNLTTDVSVLDNSSKSDSSKSSTFGKAWAQQVYDGGFEPGGFWEWIYMGGKKAILAAHILFGEDGARQALQYKAMSVPAKSKDDKFDRLNTIRSCMSSFHFQPGNLYLHAEQIRSYWKRAQTEVKRVSVDGRKPRWKPDPATAVLAVLLADANQHQRGWTKIGLRTIQRRASLAFPDIDCSLNTVRRSLDRLSSAGITKMRRSTSATSVPDVYVILKGAPPASPDWIELY